MKKLQTSKLDKWMTDVIIVHRSLWSPIRDERTNVDFIRLLKNSKVLSVKWFMQTFVDDDPKVSVSNLVAISHGLIGVWTFGSSTYLSEDDILNTIDSLWQQKSDDLDETILDIKKRNTCKIKL